MEFKLTSEYYPTGDQPEAIRQLVEGVNAGEHYQTLLGVTGSGKTFTIANVVQQTQKPMLVLSHNKTLAAQLFAEFKEYFPENSVNYFVSYYDYYQPEAYVPQRDIYIEKETDINQDIERYRNAATQAALTRKDVIIVASVSCIYGLGDPDEYTALSRKIQVGEKYSRNKLLLHLTDMQYTRSEYDFYAGLYRVRGDSIDIYLTSEELALRIEFFGDEVESLKLINPLTGEVTGKPNEYTVFPAKQYVTTQEKIKSVIGQIRQDMQEQKEAFLKAGKLLEANRLEQRVNYDLEMLEEVGYCTGIENYSRYLDGRRPGSSPSTLLDYLGEDWLMVIDESHMTVPQIGAMYNGDRARKLTLIEYGFRLKAALDNRPLTFAEFNEKLNQTIYVSATPSAYELDLSGKDAVAEQIIRPTGLLDPIVRLRPSYPDATVRLVDSLKEYKLTTQLEELQGVIDRGEVTAQIDDLADKITDTIAKGQRVLVTTLTKRMAEELTEYLEGLNVKVQYIHSDVDAIDRVEILRDLRLGKYDVLVGINILREGLDLPEVSLVCILDADKEGFLRSETSFVQTIGRAARHSSGEVIMYADKVTGSMYRAITETQRRRAIQEKYNSEHGITPTTIVSRIKDNLERKPEEDNDPKKLGKLESRMESYPSLKPKEKKALLRELKVQMEMLAEMQEFEEAATIRDFLLNNK